MMLRSCKDEQERQQLHNVIMVSEAERKQALEDDDLPDWMREMGAPSWFGSENPEQARAFVGSLPNQST